VLLALAAFPSPAPAPEGPVGAVLTFRPAVPAEVEVSRGGPPTSRTLVVEATAYSYEDGNGDGVTATGTVPRPGICAVDPKIIPLGSRLWVPGYGWARAEDTGGLIRGNRIDVFFPTRIEALEWGRRTVTVEVYDAGR
jgi:3D (Asp-Asp-Asp) domain-containing protein